MTSRTNLLRAGQTLTITADGFTSGSYYRVGDTPIQIARNSVVAIGPFAQDRNYVFESDSGLLSYTMTVADFATPGSADDFSGFASNFSTVPSTRSLTVSAAEQLALFGTITIQGTVTNAGEIRIGAWPF